MCVRERERDGEGEREKGVPMPDCITTCANVDTRVKYHVSSFGDKGFTELSALRIFLCNSFLDEVRARHSRACFYIGAENSN